MASGVYCIMYEYSSATRSASVKRSLVRQLSTPSSMTSSVMPFRLAEADRTFPQ